MGTIKNIIFDLGGVLLNIDYEKTATAFRAIGYHNFSEMYSQFTADELFQKLETGKIDKDDFYQRLAAAHPDPIPKERLTTAWNSMLLDWREESLAFLEKLSLDYRIYLLSNTNAIHMDAFHKSLRAQCGKETIDALFTKAYYSHRIHFRKPDEGVFEFVAKDAGLLREETLFIDDSENNIATALSMGFKTHLLLPGEKIEELDYTAF